MGIVAGHFGLSIDQQMLSYAEDFGLALFVYALGLQVGPGFFSSFHKGGIQLNALAIAVVLIGTFLAIFFSSWFHISLPDVVGILCGATTNTPSLAAAQQALTQFQLDASAPALGCAVAYPLGVVGVILVLWLINALFARNGQVSTPPSEENHTFISTFHISNPGIYGKTVKEVGLLSSSKYVISRLWRNAVVSIPTSETVLMQGDRILVITSEEETPKLVALFGEQETVDWNKNDIDWNSIDSQLVSQSILITKSEFNGKRLADLRLRNSFGINISRVYRNGVPLLATGNLMLQFGDRLMVVGEQNAVKKVGALLGNAVKNLEEPNLIAVFIGLILGLIVGSIPIMLPGMSSPIKLGLAGGPITVGILIGAFGPRFHMVTYTTRSANLMLRALGLSMYLACLGLDAGEHFFETVVRPEGLLWVGVGFMLTILPILLVGIVAYRFLKFDFGTVCGMLCGSMANPMALTYADDLVENDNPSIAYTTVYPLCMFLRVIIAQIIILFLYG